MQIKPYNNYAKIACSKQDKLASKSFYQSQIYIQSHTFLLHGIVQIHSPLYENMLKVQVAQSQNVPQNPPLNVPHQIAQNTVLVEQIKLLQCAAHRLLSIFFSDELSPSEKAEQLQLVQKVSSIYLFYKLQHIFNKIYSKKIDSERLITDYYLEFSEFMENDSLLKFKLQINNKNHNVTLQLRKTYGSYLIDSIELLDLKLSGYVREA